MTIKVCGMRDAENIREVEALGIDMMGFIFWPKSKRYVSEKPEQVHGNQPIFRVLLPLLPILSLGMSSSSLM